MHKNLPKALAKEIIKYQSRQGRKKASFYIVEGERCCREALKWQVDIRYAVYSETRQAKDSDADTTFPVYYISEQEFERFSLTENAQGIFYVVDRPFNTYFN